MKAVFKGQKVGWNIVLPGFNHEGYKKCIKNDIEDWSNDAENSALPSLLKEYSSLFKKKTFADNLLTLMTSKMSTSFFLQSKRN